MKGSVKVRGKNTNPGEEKAEKRKKMAENRADHTRGSDKILPRAERKKSKDYPEFCLRAEEMEEFTELERQLIIEARRAEDEEDSEDEVHSSPQPLLDSLPELVVSDDEESDDEEPDMDEPEEERRLSQINITATVGVPEHLEVSEISSSDEEEEEQDQEDREAALDRSHDTPAVVPSTSGIGPSAASFQVSNQYDEIPGTDSTTELR